MHTALCLWRILKFNCHKLTKKAANKEDSADKVCSVRFHSLELKQSQNRGGRERKEAVAAFVQTAVWLSAVYSLCTFQKKHLTVLKCANHSHFQTSRTEGMIVYDYFTREYIMCTHSRREQECSPICNFPMILIFISSLNPARRQRLLICGVHAGER